MEVTETGDCTKLPNPSNPITDAISRLTTTSAWYTILRHGYSHLLTVTNIPRPPYLKSNAVSRMEFDEAEAERVVISTYRHI